MHSSFLALCLAAFQCFRIVDSFPNPSPLLGSNWGNPKRYVHLQTSSDISNFYLEIPLNGQVRKTSSRSSYSVMLLKSEARDRLAILGVKSNRYLCMDADGNTFSSEVCSRDDCLFHHKLLENHYDVYYSCTSGLVLNLEGAKQAYVAGKNLPSYSLFLSEKNTVPLERLLHREKRTRPVDPSDPLRMLTQPDEGSDSLAYREDGDQDTELPEHGRAVSKETITSNFDDPLQVLHAMNPSSPRIAGTLG
ncbi:hypothetical protein COCON_G00116990 [Conger conger]|uniref:Fibroblast growth factor 23 n=1 Tax=Conger conger TaxID=82655 RepID=A0A9Q1DG69_CONCO|nr:hypothetical protein COCON_G00116990 [Conger conger]